MVKPIEWFSGSPLATALHGYDTDIAVQALQDPPPHPAPKEETAMTATQHRPQNAPAPSRLDVLHQAHNELADKVTRMAQVIDRLNGDLNDVSDVALRQEDIISELQQHVRTLTGRLDALPQPKARERDDTNDRIIAYLRDSVPGVWMTPGTVAANMKLDGKSVASRLDRLAGLTDAVVERTGGKNSGAHPLYRVVPPPRPTQPEA